MREPTYQKIRNEMHTDHYRIPDPNRVGGVISVVRGVLDTRQVDWKIRVREGTLQNACDYYHDGELISSGDWFRFEFVSINEAGDTVQFAHQHGGGEMPLDEWIEGAAKGHIEDELGEVWNDVKEMSESEQ